MEQMPEKRKMVLVNNELIYQNMIPLQRGRVDFGLMDIIHKVNGCNDEIAIKHVAHTRLHAKKDTNICNSFFTVFDDNGMYDAIITGTWFIVREKSLEVAPFHGNYSAVTLRFYPDDLVHYDPFNVKFTCEGSIRQ